MYIFSHIEPWELSEIYFQPIKTSEPRDIFVTLKYSYRPTVARFTTACVIYPNTLGSGRTKQEKFIVLRRVNRMFRASWQRRVADNVAGLHAKTSGV